MIRVSSTVANSPNNNNNYNIINNNSNEVIKVYKTKIW
jgi:hypothetical protein